MRCFLAITLGSLVLLCSVGSTVVESARSLQSAEEEYGCNTVLDTIPASEIKDFFITAIDTVLGDDGGAAGGALVAVFKNMVNTKSNYGIQVRRVCASCSDFDLEGDDYQRYCGPDAYGYNQSFSGLLAIPLNDKGELLEGTLPGAMHMRGTQVNDVPSNQYNTSKPDLIQFITALFPASTGNPALAPDYFGYGVSNARIYKGYIVRQGYETSIVPLWHKVEQIIREESNCTSALANELAIFGYSEGGYAAPVVATALHKLGWDIMRVHAGAIPARSASVLVPNLIHSADEGLLSRSESVLFVLLGATYSSTFRDLASFNQSQDMVKPESRDAMAELFNTAPGREEFKNYLGVDNWLRHFDQDLVQWARDAYEDPDPCQTRFEVGFNDFLCQSLKDNDITELLETAPFPIDICHGREDVVVVVDNLPNMSKNENLTLEMVDGVHDEAAGTCSFTGILYMTSGDFTNYPIEPKHSVDGCSAPPPTMAPPVAPTAAPPAPATTSASGNSPPSHAEQRHSIFGLFVTTALLLATFQL